MTPTDLGPLAFTAEELDETSKVARREFISQGREEMYSDRFTEIWVRHINAILAQKLAKAPVVWTALDEDGDNVAADAWHEYYHVGYTHKARLVCIEEIKL